MWNLALQAQQNMSDEQRTAENARRNHPYFAVAFVGQRRPPLPRMPINAQIQDEERVEKSSKVSL